MRKSLRTAASDEREGRAALLRRVARSVAGCGSSAVASEPEVAARERNGRGTLDRLPRKRSCEHVAGAPPPVPSRARGRQTSAVHLPAPGPAFDRDRHGGGLRQDEADRAAGRTPEACRHEGQLAEE